MPVSNHRIGDFVLHLGRNKIAAEQPVLLNTSEGGIVWLQIGVLILDEGARWD
jgi:hypothetical protein